MKHKGTLQNYRSIWAECNVQSEASGTRGVGTLGFIKCTCLHPIYCCPRLSTGASLGIWWGNKTLTMMFCKTYKFLRSPAQVLYLSINDHAKFHHRTTLQWLEKCNWELVFLWLFFFFWVAIVFWAHHIYKKDYVNSWSNMLWWWYVKKNSAGNELTSYGVGTSISAQQYAEDAIELRRVINSVYPADVPRPLLVAPDGFFEPVWFSAFLNASGPGVVDAVTRHIYNLGAGAPWICSSYFGK